ncbi:MAG: response regulator [Desulfobacteraceae bacterium]|nr:MAG: response regulator [Desulfobacteraceae bacterium]
MPKKILSIDDDPIVVRYLTNIFQNSGYETASASGGVEGIGVVKKEKPDLITLDLQMPEQWGPRFYQQLRKDKTLREIPIIVITGLSGGQHSIPKAAGYLSKPFNPDELMKMVRKVIGEPGD